MADAPDDQQSREELLRRSREEHARIEALLAPLTEEQLTRPGVTDDWAVKDHLAHLTWWEQRVIRVLGGGADPLDTMPGDDRSDDAINAHVYAAHRDRSLAEVRADFEASYQEMLHLIESVPDAVLAKRYGWISGNAGEHYEEHRRMLEAWRDRSR